MVSISLPCPLLSYEEVFVVYLAHIFGLFVEILQVLVLVLGVGTWIARVGLGCLVGIVWFHL